MQACKKVPEVNSSWRKDFIREYSDVNIGFAVQTEIGPVVPVIEHAEIKDLSAISKEAKELASMVSNAPASCAVTSVLHIAKKG